MRAVREKHHLELGVMADACNPSMQEVRPACCALQILVYIICIRQLNFTEILKDLLFLCVHAHVCGLPQKTEEGTRVTAVEVTGSCELPHMGVQDLC